MLEQEARECAAKDEVVGRVAKDISEFDQAMNHLGKIEDKYRGREKGADQDLDDLVEYVKWITGDLGVLRDRVRIAEKIISDLRRSGEESVESLLQNLYALSISFLMAEAKQQELDQEVDNMRDVIDSKEH